jgi:two-component system sensor histidine kinase KdpD
MNLKPTGETGRLKIFLGYAPTVGKSHAMLDAANRKKLDGGNVILGCLDLSQNTDLLPLVEELRGSNSIPLSTELDLDVVLSRKPDLVVIDELAHTNPAGFRHPRRYQDVEEILVAGIDVFTTLDVLELESLRDLVANIIGSGTIETIPDKVFQNASIIEFVDLPPEEIIQRLTHKIDTGEIPRERFEPYLSLERLSRLREIALKRAAGIIESSYPSIEAGIPGILKQGLENKNILVCVSSHPVSEKLVRAGKRMADENHSQWFVLYIETPDRVIPLFSKRERLENTLRLAEELGATIFRKTALDIPSAISSFSRQNHVSKIILGAPRRNFWNDWIGNSSLERLIKLAGSSEIVIIKYEGNYKESFQLPSISEYSTPRLSYLKAVGIVAFTTAVCFPLHFYIEPVNLVMLYLVAVMACAFYFGRGPGIVASVLSVLSFDYFMVAPRFSLTVANTEYLLTFFGLFVISLVVSGLAGQIRSQVNASRQREDHTASLYTLSQELTNVYDRDSVLKVVIDQIQQTFVRDCVIWIQSGKSYLPYPKPEPWYQDDQVISLVSWVFENRLPAGRGTDTFADSPSSFYPMVVGNQAIGVLEVKDVSRTILMNSEKRKLLEAYCGMAALAIERTRLVEEQKNAQLTLETERLQNALLSSISHDLRTPLATITGVLSSLRESEQPETGAFPLDEQTRLELIDTGWEEAERLNRVVGNLLDISRLESGALKLNLQYGDLEGIIGSVLGRLKKRLEYFQIQVDIPSDIPQVRFDPGLIEQVLYNLVDNAIKYSANEKFISISISRNPQEVLISIRDHGKGIQPEEIEKVFDKFYRTKEALIISGSGLGLSICKGIIQSHHGRIWAESNSPQGITIRFSLPLQAEEGLE